MTRTTKIILASGAFALVLATAAGVGHAGGRDCGPRGDGNWREMARSGPGAFGPGARGPMLFERFDADEDGTLTQDEVNQVRAEQLATFDADGDGSLSLEEYEALWLEAMRERMVDRFQAHDDDGDGVVTGDEFGERTNRLVQRFDRDGDGTITLDEMQRRGRDRSERPSDDE